MDFLSDAMLGMTSAGVVIVVGFALGVLWASRH